VRLALQLSVTAALPRLLLLLLLRLSELRPVSAAPGAAHPLKLVLYELCRAVTRETLGVGKLCDLLADAQLLPAAIAPVLHSNLADVFWFLGLELADVPEAEAQKKQLTLLIQDLLRDKVLSGDLLKARLEPDMLQDVGLVKDRQDFHKKQVRMNTQQLYTQQKYNLFREQSEGYSKLITELSELPASGVGSSTTSTRGCKQAAEVVANIQSLIGFFDLDPNRVLDIVLEALEAVPSRVAHRGLVGLFNPKYIPHMLGFKFQYYHGQGQTPASLYHLCGLLLHQGRVQASPPRRHHPTRCARNIAARSALLAAGRRSLPLRSASLCTVRPQCTPPASPRSPPPPPPPPPFFPVFFCFCFFSPVFLFFFFFFTLFTPVSGVFLGPGKEKLLARRSSLVARLRSLLAGIFAT